MQFIFRRRFSMAHRLILGVGGKCALPHGHNEEVVIHASPRGEFDRRGNMSMDFGDAKSVWHGFIDNALDHSFQLGSTDALVKYFVQNEPEKLTRVMITEGDPTTEMLCLVLVRKFRALCGDALALHRLEIQETPTNTVSVEPQMTYAVGVPTAVAHFLNAPVDLTKWWDRPDLSLNDLQP